MVSRQHLVALPRTALDKARVPANTPHAGPAFLAAVGPFGDHTQVWTTKRLRHSTSASSLQAEIVCPCNSSCTQ